MRRFEDKNTSILVGISTFLLLTLGVVTFVVAQSITFDKDLDLQGTKKILNAANVGIGTTTPGYPLEAVGIVSSKSTSNANNRHFVMNGFSGFTWDFYGGHGSGGYFGISESQASPFFVILSGSGSVGVGTSTPSYALTVNGTGWFNQPLIVGTPTASNHAVTKSYVDSAIVSTADMGVKGNCTEAVTIDWSAGKTQHCVLTGNVTFTFSTPQSGANYKLILKQDGIGSRTVTWPAGVRWGSLGAPNLSVVPAKTDYVGFIYNGVDTAYDGVAFNSNF